MTKKTWLIFGAICILLFGGLIYLSMRNRVDVSSIDQNKVQPALEENGEIADHTAGTKKSNVTLVEYGDFQCPYCGQAAPQMKKITEKYKDSVNIIFRNLPLTTIHQNALATAGAAEAAGLQGKYWEMHDLLYEQQNAWSTMNGNELTDTLVGYAKQLGINTETFRTDLGEARIQKKINFDRALFAKFSNSPSTPLYLINGKQISNDVLQNIIASDGSKLDQALAEALKK